jgi:hypothetical protein
VQGNDLVPLVTNYILFGYCSDAFKQRKVNLDIGGPRNGASSPAADGEEASNPAAGSPAIFSTRAQKVSFLKGLSNHEQYQAACKMLKGSLSFDTINGLPVWASWSFGAPDLPQSFYEIGGLELAIADIGTVASSIDTIKPTLLLAFGLALRGLSTGREINAVTALPMDRSEEVNANGLADDAEGRILGIIERTM